MEIRDADPADDRDALESLWLAYLTWGNDELEARYGFRLPVKEAVERDMASIAKFQPPDGVLLVAHDEETPIGTASLQLIGESTAEIKRMWVEPSARRAGVGRAMLDELVERAGELGAGRIRLDSPDFMTAAHALYRSRGFIDIPPYEESEIPRQHHSHWVFMERVLE